MCVEPQRESKLHTQHKECWCACTWSKNERARGAGGHRRAYLQQRSPLQSARCIRGLHGRLVAQTWALQMGGPKPVVALGSRARRDTHCAALLSFSVFFFTFFKLRESKRERATSRYIRQVRAKKEHRGRIGWELQKKAQQKTRLYQGEPLTLYWLDYT